MHHGLIGRGVSFSLSLYTSAGYRQLAATSFRMYYECYTSEALTRIGGKAVGFTSVHKVADSMMNAALSYVSNVNVMMAA